MKKSRSSASPEAVEYPVSCPNSPLMGSVRGTEWGCEWTEWSLCSATCGKGLRSRIKPCFNCKGPEVQRQVSLPSMEPSDSSHQP